jgi:flagellar biosynthesis chaperone FliJ
VPSIGEGAVPMKRKEVSSCLKKHVGISFSQSRHQTIQHYLDTTSSTLDKSLKTATHLRVQLQMVQTLM